MYDAQVAPALTESAAIRLAKSLRELGYRLPAPMDTLHAVVHAMMTTHMHSSKLQIQACWGFAWIAAYADAGCEAILACGGLLKIIRD